MLKVMFVLTVVLLQNGSDPVVISRHSTAERCEKAFQSFRDQFAKHTSGPSFASTAIRTYACTETEVWTAERE